MTNRNDQQKGVGERTMSEIISADVAVAGAGGAGLAAAHAAAERGLKVVVLEKLDQIGGNTRISSGFFAIDTPEQRALGLQLSKEEAIARLLSYNHYLANAALIANVVGQAGDTLEWLKRLGMEIKLNEVANTTQFAHRGDPYKGGSYHMYQNKDACYERIQHNLESEGVQFRFGVILQGLRANKAGEVIGLRATDEHGQEIVVDAPGVVVATGGFGGDKDKVARVMKTRSLRSLGVPSNGEGLVAMEALGAVDIDGTALIHAAQLTQSEVTQVSTKKHLAGFSHNPLTQLLLSPLLWVDAAGARFTNEDVVYDTVEWANAGWSVGGKYFFLVDAATLDAYTAGPALEISQAGPGASKGKGDFRALADEAVEGKIAFRAATLGELAAVGGFAPDTLQNTVDAYNAAIVSKHDARYGKSAKSLAYSVEKGPFYAFAAQVVYLGTVGGVRVDEHLRVLDARIRPIPGLFTGGANAGGYYAARSYPTYEGLASGFSWTSGRIAGTSAAQYVEARRSVSASV